LKVRVIAIKTCHFPEVDHKMKAVSKQLSWCEVLLFASKCYHVINILGPTTNQQAMILCALLQSLVQL